MAGGCLVAKSGAAQMMRQGFVVRNRSDRQYKLIPYVGCKSGFSHIFDSLIPQDCGRIYDIFGGGGGFTFYACKRFGSENVVYNDHNPVLVNLMQTLIESPDALYDEYQKHYCRSDPQYYLRLRKADLAGGIRGAGRFFYLAKNAFSGKIRFNSKNEFNAPMRKNARCPRVSRESLRELGDSARHLTVSCRDFGSYGSVRGGLVYLDPPYMDNTNGHYNATVRTDAFAAFVRRVQDSNRVVISEQNSPEHLGLSGDYRVYGITLNRSLQYVTQDKSREIIAINYSP